MMCGLRARGYVAIVECDAMSYRPWCAGAQNEAWGRWSWWQRDQQCADRDWCKTVTCTVGRYENSAINMLVNIFVFIMVHVQVYTPYTSLMRRSASCAADTVFSHPRSLDGRVAKRKLSQKDTHQPTARRHHERPGPGHHDLGQGAYVHYTPSALYESLLKQLVDTTPWLHRAVTVMGRRVMQPRLVCYMS